MDTLLKYLRLSKNEVLTQNTIVINNMYVYNDHLYTESQQLLTNILFISICIKKTQGDG